MNTVQASTPVAPVVGTQGTSTPGGHYVAYKAQPIFAPTATLELISGTNPWRHNTPGFDFYTMVLAQKPATVQKAIELGAASKRKFTGPEVQNHLRWLYTWGGSYIRIGGKVFSPPPGAVRAPKPAPAKKAPKASKSS
jgi:hypothetical protein